MIMRSTAAALSQVLLLCQLLHLAPAFTITSSSVTSRSIPLRQSSVSSSTTSLAAVTFAQKTCCSSVVSPRGVWRSRNHESNRRVTSLRAAAGDGKQQGEQKEGGGGRGGDAKKEEEEAPPPPPAPEAKAEEEKKPDPEAEIKAKIASLSAKVLQAENVLAAAQEKAKESGKTGYMLLAAEVENYRRRSKTDNKGLSATAKASTLGHFNKVLQQFEEAEAILKPETEGEVKYHNSYQGLYRQFFDVFTKLGGSSYQPAAKEPYNSLRHEKFDSRVSEDVAEGLIIECVREGLVVEDQPFRKALVVVSEGSAQKKQEAEEAKKKAQQEEEAKVIDTEAVASEKK